MFFFWKVVSLITLCREGPFWPEGRHRARDSSLFWFTGNLRLLLVVRPVAFADPSHGRDASLCLLVLVLPVSGIRPSSVSRCRLITMKTLTVTRLGCTHYQWMYRGSVH
jgi:hypothetical protein